MALFSQNMPELVFELTLHDPTYEDSIVKFAEHFYYIASAMNKPGSDGMWDDEDGFYYDLLRLPDGSATRGHQRVPRQERQIRSDDSGLSIGLRRPERERPRSLRAGGAQGQVEGRLRRGKAEMTSKE
jgi:hypothetical protein